MKELSKTILWIINLSLYLLGLATWASIPDSLTLNVSISLMALFMTLLLVLPKRKHLWIYLKSSRFKNLLSCMLAVFLVFSIVGIINYLGVKNPWQKDFTKEQKNSLSLESQKILKGIQGPLSFKVFTRRTEQGTIMPLLELYRFYKSDIDIELLDPDLKPEKVKEYGVLQYGTVLIEYAGRRNFFLDHSELQITRALLKIHRPKSPVLYYTTGHQELDLMSEKQQGLSHLKSLMVKELYDLRPINLAKEAAVPQDADGLMILGPKTAFFATEIKIIESFMKRGGRMLVNLDPHFNQSSLQELSKSFEQWGLAFQNDLIVDLKSYVNGSQFTVPLISHYHQEHPITQNFSSQTFFPLATSIQPYLPKKDEYNFYNLAQSNAFPSSWAEKNFNEVVLGKTHFTEGRDEKGPVSVMVATEEKVPTSGKKKKVVAIGNSTFIQNIYSRYGANFTLFLNALSWLLDEEFSIHSQISKNKEELFLLSTPQVGLIFYFSMIFCPIILLSGGFYIYKKRQKL